MTFMMMGVGGEGGAQAPPPPGSTTTWDPANKGPDITLSNGNLTAAGSANTDNIVHATTTETLTGQWYWEVTVNGGAGCGVGFVTATSTTGTFLGGASNTLGYYPSGLIYAYSGTPITMPTYSGTNIICFAWDAPNKKLYIRLNNGNWNNSGTANPSTNTGGLDISVAGNPAQCAAAAGKNTTDIATANFGQSAFTFAVPSGFTNFP